MKNVSKKGVETIHKESNTLKFISFTFQNVTFKYCFVGCFLPVIMKYFIEKVQKQFEEI